MCLIGFSWLEHPDYKLVLVANRDEFYERPSLPLMQWDNGIIAGKDLQAGGTWMGITEKGRFAAVTNYRENLNPPENYLTRGDLVKDFLLGNLSPRQYLEKILPNKDRYQGFNLLVGTSEEMYYFSNKSSELLQISSGLHGLSNAFMNTSWPKAESLKEEMKKALSRSTISEEDFFQIMRDESTVNVEKLNDTGFGMEIEVALSPKFVRFLPKTYGTVNTTLILWKHDGSVTVRERTFHPENLEGSDQKLSFVIQ
jgi:uncharacterized protein with NRDE domain